MKKFVVQFALMSTVLSLFSILKAATITEETIAQQLGWVETHHNRCGGYYFESPFSYTENSAKKNLIEVHSSQGFFALHGTSVIQGNVTVTRLGQQITANKISFYRDPQTGKLNTIDLSGGINLREPNNLIIAKTAHLDMLNKSQSLNDILYRTTIYGNTKTKPALPSNKTLQKSRQVYQLNAWGEAKQFIQDQPKIYHFQQASYSTCPPNASLWQVKASRIELNKNTGRGSATHARLYLKKIPIFYAPYLNFPIDRRRQTGFLSPQFSAPSSTGATLTIPFYWNIAPNYDDTLTPAYSDKRHLQVTNLFRYLTPHSNGQMRASILPNDKQFGIFQSENQSNQNMDPLQFQANLRRLEQASTTRGALSWQHNMQFSDKLFSKIDYNVVSDDYYLRDISHNLTEVTENQLLQQAELEYKDTHWNFIGRIQQYQTLHPVDSTTPFLNQYKRLPQLVLGADYPDQPYGLDYFITNDLTHFDIQKTPGTLTILPIGNRLNIQPGISLPLNWPYLYITPRIQFAATQYELSQVTSPTLPTLNRELPIFDIGSGLYFDRDITLLGHALHQSLEPQIYYTYIPYRDQTTIPIFDTTLNTLTYDQLFTYNRFSGLDRIGDANQVAIGLSTSFVDVKSGFERIHAGIGQLIYFATRRVTLCTMDNPNCLDPVSQESNLSRRSPISATLDYHLTRYWGLVGNTIWNTHTNAIDNQSIGLQYQPDKKRVVNLGYNFVRYGDILATDPPNSSISNLKQVDFSFSWPVLHDWSVTARLTKSINRGRFQNQLYGLQYDSCCWAIRFVTGRTFTHLDPNNNPVYDTQFYAQFALRGLANVSPTGDPNLLLGSIPGYNTNFGQDF